MRGEIYKRLGNYHRPVIDRLARRCAFTRSIAIIAFSLQKPSYFFGIDRSTSDKEKAGLAFSFSTLLKPYDHSHLVILDVLV